MTPAIVQLILQFGLQYGPSVMASVVKLFNPAQPVQADWDALIAQCSTTARQQMMAVLTAQGIDPASDKGKALLALTGAA